jgi:tight adherence protein B
MVNAAFLIALACGFATWLLLTQLQQLMREYRVAHSELAAQGLADLFFFVAAARLWRASLLLAVFGGLAIGVVTRSGSYALVTVLLCCALPWFLYRRLRRQRLRRLALQLPDCLSSLATALRAGLSPSQAIAEASRHLAAPAAQELALVSRKQRLGVSLEQALQEMAQRAASNEYAMLVSFMALARESGGGVAESFDRLAASSRRQLAMQDKIAALTSQGRMQGVIVSLLPLVLGLTLLIADRDAMLQALASRYAWIGIGAIAMLQMVGWLLIRRIVNIAV